LNVVEKSYNLIIQWQNQRQYIDAKDDKDEEIEEIA